MSCRIEVENTINKSIIEILPFRLAEMSIDGARKISKELNDLWGPIAKPIKASPDTYQVAIFGLEKAIDREFTKQVNAEQLFKRNLDFFNGDVALYDQEQREELMLQKKEGYIGYNASPKTIGMLKEFIKRIGVDIQGLQEIVVDGVKLDANGAALLMQKLIQIVNGKEAETLPEEAMHFAVAIIKQTNPTLYKQLMNEINQYKLLNEVFAEYASDPLYQNADGKPNVIKLKEEAIAKVLAETIIKHAENLSEKSSLLEKTQSWWDSIVNFFKTLFSKSGFDQLSLDIISGKEIGTAEDIKEKADAAFLQKGSQESIMDQLDNISNKIELKDDGYYILGIKIPRRVSDLTHDWYERRFADKELTKTEHQKAVDDLKAEKGTAGHAALEYAFKVLVDEKGYIRTQPLDDTDYETVNPGISRDMYEILKKNLILRLNSFDKGTRFKSEITVYDAKRGLAGTIDFLAIEPNGKTHVLDWKFMNLNIDKHEDIPWYKVNAWNLQMNQYKLILQNVYGINSEDFGQTRMIPILTSYSEGNAKLNILPKLLSIKIGDVNVKNIAEAYLLPVGLESEKTGNKNIDKLLEKLNAMYKRFSDKKVLPSEKMNKAEQLNKLFTAIRQLHIKNNLKPLLIQAKVLNQQIQKIIEVYHSKYEGKDPKSFNDKDINDFSAELLTAIEAIHTYTNLSIDLKSLFHGILSTEDQKLKDSLRDTTDEAQDIQSTLYDVIDSFVQDIIAKSEGVESLLAPEKIIKGLSKLFSSTATLQLKSIEVLYKKANKSFAYAGMDTLTEAKRLEEYKKNYESWAQRKELNRKNFFDILKKKGSNELIDEYNPEFYKTLKQKIAEKDTQWIKDNINVTEYKVFINDKLQKELKRIDDKPRVGTDEENAIEVSLEKYNANKLYNTSADDSVGWLLYDYILKFPRDSWKSKEWNELNKPENKAAKDFYDYIIEKNNEYKELGYITNPRTFLPYVRKGLTEKLATGGQVKVFEQTLRNITVDEGDIGYGQKDPLTGKPIDTIPKYFTTKIDGELSEDLFKTMSMYNESAIRYKYLIQIEDQIRAIATVEKNKRAIDTSIFGKTKYKDGEIQYSTDNSENSKLFEDMMKGIIYGQRYITSESFDQVLGKIGKWGTTLNDKLGVKIFPEDLEGRQLSVNKTITQFNSTFQISILGFNILSASSNLFGGNIHSMINAGTYFTKTDYIAAEGILFMKMLGGTDKQKMIGALEYFLPLTENYNREFSKGLSLSKMNAENIQDTLMFLMRHSDLNVQMSNFYAYLKNTIVQDGQVMNAREYLRTTDKYADKYAGTSEQRKFLEEEFEKDIKEIIETKGVLKIATVVDGKFNIPGVEQKSASVVELRRKVQQISKDALGNLSEDDLRKINMQVLGKSIMVFKNWIPRLVDVRMGNMKYNSASDAYEWGRMRMVMRILNDGVFSSLSRFRNAWLGNDKGVEYMRTLFEKKKADYENDTGKTLNMTEAEFLDLVRKNIKSQAIDLTIMLSLVGLVLALKAYSPPDDEDPAVKSQYRFMVRAIDKFKDELSYFYNPSSVTGLLSMGFPVMTLVNNIEKGFTHFFIENWAIATGNEKLKKSNQVIKYWMKTFPIANQMVGYLPMFYPELAKDMGVKIQANYGIR